MSKVTTKSVIKICIAFLIPLIVIFELNVISNAYRSTKNGFLRNFTKLKIVQLFKVPLSDEENYIAGHTNLGFYLSNSTKGGLYYCAFDNQRSDLKSIPCMQILNGIVPAVSVNDKYIFYYYLPGSSPLFRATIDDPEHITDTVIIGLYNGISIGSGPAILIRRYDSLLRQNVIGLAGPNSNEWKPYIMKKQKDGIFCTDGFFIRDFNYNTTGYVYYYRNQAIIFDDSMRTANIETFIDTNSTAKVELDSVGSGVTLSNLPRMVNRNGCINGNDLYIQSELKSDNELSGDFDNNLVIDHYSIRKSEYLGSFYLPKTNDGKLISFCISEHRLFALYNKALVSYRISG